MVSNNKEDNDDDVEAGLTAAAAAARRSSPDQPSPWWDDEAIWLRWEELTSSEQIRMLRTTVTVLLCVSVVIGLCAAAAQAMFVPATTTALSSAGVGVLFFLAPFSLYMRLMLWPCLVEDMHRGTLACLVAAPVLLHAAAVAYLQLMGRGQVAFAALGVWLVDVAAAAALGWCFWNDRR
uniref:Uncharacterized protein n=1 Tax=Oryza glumipatula TaxID=40148 RepID=A0A0D9Z2X5_9ORYZ